MNSISVELFIRFVTLRTQAFMSRWILLPTPFQYVYLLNLMILTNLLFQAYAMGVTDSTFASVSYFFAALFFTGMMVLVYQLSHERLDTEADRSIVYLREFLKDR